MHTLIFLILLNYNLYSSLSGLINIGITDSSGTLISKAAAFVVYDTFNNKKYLLSSFHVLNLNLLLAENIVDLDNKNNLKILAYDEEFDILVLDASLYEDYFLINKNCDLTKLVASAYYKDKTRYANLKDIKALDSFNSGIKRTSTYLPKGFSGAPVIDEKALICGMVLLSSEGNSSSIYIDSNLIVNVINEKKLAEQSISSIRRNLGLEVEIDNNNDLRNYLMSKANNKQSVIVLKPEINNEKYTIKNAANFILKSYTNISGIELKNVDNAMLSSVSLLEGLEIINSNNVSVVSSNFIRKEALINISASNNILVKNNKFINLNAIHISNNSSSYQIEDNYLF